MIFLLLNFLQQALEERSSLQSLNSQLQHKLAEYYKKKKVSFYTKCYQEKSFEKVPAKFESLTKLLMIGSICFQSDERQQEIEKNVTDQEQRYLKYMCKC